LRQKKALELRRKMLLSQSKPPEIKALEPPANPRETVSKILVGRAGEVMDTARRYYPAEVGELETRLAELIQAGSLKGPISGEDLYAFLRRVGLDFSMDTKIRIREGGKLKSLEEKLRNRES
jgi:DNA-binding TFAR19-related protein (PDSD5 family)